MPKISKPFSFVVIFCLMAIMQGCSALQGHSEQDSSLTSSFNTFEASLNIKQIDGVHQDYIH